jgi:hypothetical protein
MQSKAATVAEYLAALPADRRAAICAVREVILANLDPQYAEAMQYGMIGYAVPHSVFPAGYHCDTKQPLPFAALASQKNYMSLYMMGLYCGCSEGEETDDARWFRAAWRKQARSWTWARPACASGNWMILRWTWWRKRSAAFPSSAIWTATGS